MIRLAYSQPQFHFVGIAESFVLGKKGKIKSFELATEKGKYNIKIPHKLHKKMNYNLKPQTKLEVIGKIDICFKTAKIKLKPEVVKIINDHNQEIKSQFIDIETPVNEPLGKILICQKSNCWKKGGAEIYQKILTQLENLGLTEQVIVKKTGCMGKCNAGPNLVVLPDKTRYSSVQEQEVCHLINHHFS